MSSLTNCLAGWHFYTHNSSCRGTRFASTWPHCASTDGGRASQQRSIRQCVSAHCLDPAPTHHRAVDRVDMLLRHSFVTRTSTQTRFFWVLERVFAACVERRFVRCIFCLLYTSDAADEEDSVDLG